MKYLFAIVLLSALAFGQQGVRPAWAFPVADKEQPKEEESKEPRQIPGSTKSYTPAQLDDLFNAPDWFPAEHGPVPQVVVKGTPPNPPACGTCHLMSGQGHPESADIAGMPVEYLVRQMADFKNGARKDTARMNAISKGVSDEDSKAAAEWATALKPGPWVKVVEADTVPKSYVRTAGRMRLPLSGAGSEPLGKRIVELPDDASRVAARDPKSGFTAYVPKGSIAKGKALASAAPSKTITCAICHGEGLKGLGNVPRIAGLHPIYIGRQLSNFQTGAASGIASALMKKVVANLTEDDMINLAAYAASLNP